MEITHAIRNRRKAWPLAEARAMDLAIRAPAKGTAPMFWAIGGTKCPSADQPKDAL